MKFYQIPCVTEVRNDFGLVQLQGTGNPQIPECVQQGGDCGNDVFYNCNQAWVIKMEVSNASCETFSPLNSCSFRVNDSLFLSNCQIDFCEDADTNQDCGTSAYYEISCPDNLIVSCGQAAGLDVQCDDGSCDNYTFVQPQ